MNDEPMDETSPDDAHIRALLAELGSGPDGRPMPPEVAARLDDTLARLVAERAGSPESGPESAGDPDEHVSAAGNVVPFRRRWVPRATAAAAAVVILGAGSVAVANLGILGSGTDSSVSSDSAGGSSEEKVAQEGAEGESVPNASPSSPTSGDTALIPDRTTALALPEVSASSFESDVTTLLRPVPLDDASESPTSGSDSGSGGTTAGQAREASRSPRTPMRMPGSSSETCWVRRTVPDPRTPTAAYPTWCGTTGGWP